MKPQGLWNDEYVSWFVASTPFDSGFWQEIIKQCHMPLYYLYLKPFANCSDLILRLTSVLPGILAIPVMYLVGKEFSPKTGFFVATITSTLSFLIYYSQEVRFYSLLFLFSAISLLFTIKYIKTSNKINLIGYILSSSMIISTHVLGGIYVLFNILYVFYKKKKINFTILSILSFVIILSTPLLLNILQMLPASQWWGKFSYTNLLFLFSDYFSPILTNNINAPTVFFYKKELFFGLTIPTLIALTGILSSIKNIKGYLSIAFLNILFLSILAKLGYLVFITKYSIEILPILILAIGIGFRNLKKAGIVLLTIFVMFHILAFFTPNYVTKIQRNEGHRIPAEIINARKPDIILYTYYEPNRFFKYLNHKPSKALYISKINRYEYRKNPKLILQNIKPGDKISVIFLDSVSFFDENFIRENINNPKIPEMFLTFSNIKNCLIKELNTNYSNFQVDKLGSWTVITAIKIK